MSKTYYVKDYGFVESERYSFEGILEIIGLEKSTVSTIVFLKENGKGSKEIKAGASIKVTKYTSFTIETQETGG